MSLNALEIVGLGGFSDEGGLKTRLLIEGDVDDSLITTDNWVFNGVVDYGGESYKLFEQGTYELLVDVEIDTRRAIFDDRLELLSGAVVEAIDGGLGFDTLVFVGAFELDLMAVDDGLLNNIEAVDLGGTGVNSLILNAEEIVALGGFSDETGMKTRLLIEGDADDVIITKDSWEENGTVDYKGESYQLFELEDYQLLVDRDMSTRDIGKKLEITSGNIVDAIVRGLGFDTLVLVGDFDLDLTAIDNHLLGGIDKIDLSGTGDNELVINELELEGLGGFVEDGKTKLIIEGDVGDSVRVGGGVWSIRDETNEGVTLVEQGDYQLIVSSDVLIDITDNIDLGSELVELGVGFRVFGEDGEDRSGFSVSDGGDVNGDGYDDFIIGAYLGEEGGELNEGISYVIYGKASGFVNMDLGDGLGVDEGFRIIGDDRGDNSGKHVSNLGDINGDGYDDLAVGAPWADEGDIFFQGIILCYLWGFYKV